MIDTILFDLDGTLLASDLDEQLNLYLTSLSAYTQGHFPALADSVPQDMMHIITRLVRGGTGGRTVFEAFWDMYCDLSGVEEQTLRPPFDRYYVEEYPKVGSAYAPVPALVEIVKACKAGGKRLCLATNAFYPLTAVQARLAWAGMDADDFALITHYENMHHLKPDLGYYREVLDRLGAKAENCAMVGNNGAEDMCAASLGLRTFLLEGFAMEGECYDGPRGDAAALRAWLGQL